MCRGYTVDGMRKKHDGEQKGLLLKAILRERSNTGEAQPTN